MTLQGITDDRSVPLNAVCQRRDFRVLRSWFREIFQWGADVFGDQYPVGAEYRKHWEVVQAARAFHEGGVLGETAEVLGVGAGTEPTLFWLTNHVRRVFATDLYLAEGWEESASSRMMTDPGTAWRGPWNPRRLVVQHMDALDLRYEDDSFDGVFSSSSIEHFGGYDEVRRSVEEAYRVLRPGGVFAVSTEMRVSGPDPHLPDILMFTWDQLHEFVIDAAPWNMLGGLRESFPEADVPVQPFDEAAEYVQSHVARYGEIVWHELHWPRLPHILLSHSGCEWTSVHLALRKT